MSNLDFIELAYEHWEALLFCISFSFICYILIFKSWYISILDPFVLSAVLSACGFGVVIFLFLCNAIQLKYFVSYLLTQFAFISGMLLFNRIGFRKLKNKFYILDENKLLRIIYIIVIFSVVIIQFIILVFLYLWIRVWKLPLVEVEQGYYSDLLLFGELWLYFFHFII